MALNIVSKDSKETVTDASFTFVITDSGMMQEGEYGNVYIVDCLVDGYFITGTTFSATPETYAAKKLTAIAQAMATIRGKREIMRAEIARLQAIVDKIAGV